jgi:predicted nucleic acid-binding protein
MFVLDTSVTMGWCFEDEACATSDLALDSLRVNPAMAPAIWPLEVGNVLLVGERRGRLTEAQSSRFLELLAQLPIEVDDSPTDLGSVVAIGRNHGLSSYDASYLALAVKLGVRLATVDGRMAEAARRTGVQLLDELWQN